MTDEPDYQDEWEQLDEKVLLASILAEQQRTNQLLAKLAGEDTDTDAEQEATPMYACDYCGTEVREQKRQRHAEGQHNVPPGEWEFGYTQVEP